MGEHHAETTFCPLPRSPTADINWILPPFQPMIHSQRAFHQEGSRFLSRGGTCAQVTSALVYLHSCTCTSGVTVRTYQGSTEFRGFRGYRTLSFAPFAKDLCTWQRAFAQIKSNQYMEHEAPPRTKLYSALKAVHWRKILEFGFMYMKKSRRQRNRTFVSAKQSGCRNHFYAKAT